MVGRVIKGALVAGLAGLALAGAVAARDGEDGPPRRWGGHWSRLSPEDRAAFADARIAALHAGLRLNADQEKLWPPVETAMRDLARQRRERMAAMRDRKRMDEDAPAALRAMADAATARGAALGKLADASGPLYATLDPDQKRRAMILAGPMGGHRHRHGGRGEDGGEGEQGPRDGR
ncbi:Spy/CpxP family protein refolding chaperone [Methylobacterium sp. E-041]|jgi:zinc resistance-associated protein|nr:MULTISPECIES: Spy/CpxP family protein refolding chaperone [unclassified Methylobacterium]MCJ2041318.1 Spy/CpxP family protein refolding chaperone [Methylobacterium sp. J-059]MCJ2104486.1 Spy/CpxP family protein refolding chaperone [Methylobacterium sp. E-041]MCJ2111695.1 Spy/CpxP family protein refolding chaperone [Methylobacterium sp. E-025]